MADEIREITRDPIKGGRLRFCVLDLCLVGEPVLAKGNTVVLTPRSELPVEVTKYRLLGDNADTLMELMDAGTLVFREDCIEQLRGETLSSVLERVRLRYEKVPLWIEEQRARWAHAGDSYDK
jgi:hypothetical protein